MADPAEIVARLRADTSPQELALIAQRGVTNPTSLTPDEVRKLAAAHNPDVTAREAQPTGIATEHPSTAMRPAPLPAPGVPSASPAAAALRAPNPRLGR